jgi:hypothetical protein
MHVVLSENGTIYYEHIETSAHFVNLMNDLMTQKRLHFYLHFLVRTEILLFFC